MAKTKKFSKPSIECPKKSASKKPKIQKGEHIISFGKYHQHLIKW